MKKLFLKVLQDSQENIFAGVSLWVLLATSLEQRLRQSCFPANFCKVFENITFDWTPPMAASFRHKMQNIKNTLRQLYVTGSLFDYKYSQRGKGFYISKKRV